MAREHGDALRLYRDDGDGVFEPQGGGRAMLQPGAPFDPSGGLLTLTLPGGDPDLQLAAGSNFTW